MKQRLNQDISEERHDFLSCFPLLSERRSTTLVFSQFWNLLGLVSHKLVVITYASQSSDYPRLSFVRRNTDGMPNGNKSGAYMQKIYIYFFGSKTSSTIFPYTRFVCSEDLKFFFWDNNENRFSQVIVH